MSFKIDDLVNEVFLVTPPFTQLNTPYPATAYLKGFLNTRDISSYQIDLGIEVILKLFASESLETLFQFAKDNNRLESANSQRIYALRSHYLETIDIVLEFLQGKHQTLARNICSGNYLPQASRFEQLENLEWAFGDMGMQDQAKHLSTLYLEDLSDFIVECVDDNFGFSRYAERLGRSANSFDQLHSELQEPLTYIDRLTLELLEQRIVEHSPKLICFSVPFPGNLYSAFRCAQHIKKVHPSIKTAMGGGFPNTELRSISDVRVFSFFDFITLDDGELPVELLVKHGLKDQPNTLELKRTFLLSDGKVVYNNTSKQPDYKQIAVGTPDYSDLKLDRYISVIEIANPMHSLWSDGRWNKLTMAHGCYWGKCTFCDVSLDYIKLYEPVTAKLLVDRMETMIEQTGERGFHFVDEAAPPALMRALALEIIQRKLSVTWWTNIRFEKNFTKELCLLLKHSGCIAVSGGLEVASDRLLALIQKGITVEQVARVTANFTEADIKVHAYLMYGYPTQTVQETIDSLEMVRQLFELGIIQSGFWHQFALTAHSPVGLNPSEYGIVPQLETITFADNDVQFKDRTGIDHDQFSFGLKKSLYNFMHSIGFDMNLQSWFDFKIPKTTIAPHFIEEALQVDDFGSLKPSLKPIWLGGEPKVEFGQKTKRGETFEFVRMSIHQKSKCVVVVLNRPKGEWWLNQLEKLSASSGKLKITIAELKEDFEKQFEAFELFWYSKPIIELREEGILLA